jgi:hypothetical protein
MGFQQTHELGCKRMKASLSAMRLATSSCSHGDAACAALPVFFHGKSAHLLAAMGSKLGGRSLGMQMKA